ncbi:PucR family transcriptional regulator [Alkalihalobacterium bogoriense]|uniref:PucR family transcriptional regulator n=1 Tax=Alkalihalobacterium bogoriense TaxID=246272 RepID=UPI00047D6541|nr:helix-turn-helix domain-containing protein [Alkalihalobacterium bogoriense]
MINKLIAKYGDAVITASTPKQDSNIIWYTTEQDDIIGFHKNKIPEGELQLLSLFLTPFSPGKSFLSPLEKEWTSFLFDRTSTTDTPPHPNLPFRFIHFKSNDGIGDQEAFQAALTTIHSANQIIIWEDPSQGVIIEKLEEHEDEIDYSELCAALISDFYLNLSFFIGEIQTDANLIQDNFLWERKCFQTVRKYLPKQSVFTSFEATPFLLLQHVPENQLQQFSTHVLKDVKEDKELLTSIQTYFACNLNTTLAAKQLFMHRNSLQYRVDKFIEKTNYDIKQFQEATIVYLALLVHQSYQK